MSTPREAIKQIKMLRVMEAQAKEIERLETRIVNIEKGRQADIDSWRGKLAKANLAISEHLRTIDRLERNQT